MDHFLRGWIADGAWRLELRFYKFLLLVLHALPPETGVADIKGSARPAAPNEGSGINFEMPNITQIKKT